MYAQIWAVCCLVTVASFPALAQGIRVEVLLRNASGTPEVILEEMKSELSALMERAGFQVQWRGEQASAVAGDLVIVEVRGSCEAPSTTSRHSRIVKMGSSAVADGKVLPFSWIDCTVLAQVLEPYLTQKPAVEREFVYGRAMARVLAHELYHVLGHTLAHTVSGLTKARLEAGDLLNEHAEFGNAAAAYAQDSARASLFSRPAIRP